MHDLLLRRLFLFVSFCAALPGFLADCWLLAYLRLPRLPSLTHFDILFYARLRGLTLLISFLARLYYLPFDLLHYLLQV